jgi:kelch-like protein 8/kelch-like protein 20
VEAYNPTTNAWSTLTSLPTARFWLVGAAAACPPAQVGTCLYAVGGFSSTGTIGTVEAYNPVTNAWSTLAPLPTARGDLAAAAAPCPPGQPGTCVYAVGGYNTAGTTMGTVEALDPPPHRNGS